jgi:hypothetical protein
MRCGAQSAVLSARHCGQALDVAIDADGSAEGRECCDRAGRPPPCRFSRIVAIDALGAGAALLVMKMFHDIEFRRQMALRAEPIALLTERQTVRLMAIGAGDAGMIHATLDERAIFEHLAVDLTIGMIETGIKQGGQVGIEESRAYWRILCDHLAARVATGTNVEFL